MNTNTLNVRGTQLAYSDEGDGPIVINAHGLVQSRAADRALGLVNWSALVNAGYRVISYDARGHGESVGTADPRSYRWDALAEDLLAVADHFSPEEPVRAMGISMGTATIATALTIAPERFASVVLGAPPTAWETRSQQGAMYEQFARMVEERSAEEFAEALAGAPVAPIFQELPSYPGAPTPEHDILPSVFRGAGQSDLPSPDLLTAIGTPALILAWATDPGHPLSTAERLAELLPTSSLHISESAADIRTWASRAATFFSETDSSR